MRHAFLLIATLGLLFACSRQGGLAGKWRATGNSGMVWEFNDDGAVTQGTVHGRYSFGNDERIKIETPFSTAIYHMQLQGDNLVLTDGRGARLDFTRLKDTR